MTSARQRDLIESAINPLQPEGSTIINRVHGGIGPLGGDGESDASAARTHVDHHRRLEPPDQLECRLDQDLGLGPGDEHVRRDQELVAPEGLCARDVLQRTAGGPLFHEREEPLRVGLGHGVGAASDDGRAVPAEHVAQQQLGVEGRLGNAGVV